MNPKIQRKKLKEQQVKLLLYLLEIFLGLLQKKRSEIILLIMNFLESD